MPSMPIRSKAIRSRAVPTGAPDHTFPRKPMLTTILNIRCKQLIYKIKVGRLGLEPRTKALKGPCSTN
jgi:hypothetical protein